jgi:type I restriction enzyme, S subunit
MANGKYQLPDGWAWSTLGEVTQINPRDVSLRTLPDDLPVTFLPMAAVDAWQGVIVEPEIRPLKSVRKGFTAFSDGDVLFAKITPSMENGKAAIAKNLENGIGFGSTEFHVFRPKEKVTANWIYHFIRQERFRQDAKAHFAGTAGQLRVPASFLIDYPLPLPPLPEQERIVAKIEELFTQLEAGTSALERVRAELRWYKASLLKAACEGKLIDSKLGIGDEPSVVTLRRYRNEPLYLDELPILPDRWCYTRINALLSETRTGLKTGPFGSLLKKHEHRETGVPVFGIENIGKMEFVLGSKIYISEEKAKQLEGYAALAGDVLISRSGTVGEVCVVPENMGEARISTNIMRVVLNQEIILSKFFVMLFNGAPFVLDQVTELCKGSTRDFLNQTILKSIVFPLPPLEEQRQIVAEVERRLSVARQVENAVEEALVRASRLRQAVLRSAFEGRF